MQARRHAGATVYECGLCGAQIGDRRAVDAFGRVDEAARHGVEPEIWPLVRALAGLEGFARGAASAGAPDRLPFVEVVVTGQAALTEVENVTKTLRLAARSLRCRWRFEARFEQTLVFVLTTSARDSLRDAHIDVEVLAEQLERNRRLAWWRRYASADDVR